VCIGGHCGSTVLLLAGSPTADLLAGAFQTGSGWTTTTLADKASFGTSLTMDSTGRGVGVYASATSATGNVVSSTVWSNGSWGAPSAIAATAVARSQPYVDATGGTTSHLVYQDATYQYWYLGYSGTWSTPQQIGASGTQFYGPFAATIAALGTSATVSFFDGAGDGHGNFVNWVATSDLVSGTWHAKVDIAGTSSTIGGSNTYTIPTAVIPFDGGPQELIVYVDGNNKVMFMTGSGMSWSAPVYINDCLTNDPVALAPLPNGGAILAFKGQDGNLYWSVHSGGMWSAVAPFATPNVMVDATPAVTHGSAGDVAEIAYVSGGRAYHARLIGNTWSTPVLVGGAGLTGVAIAAAP
jgi:hypothetical protein